MDKRLLNFMLVSMLLFVGYMELLKLNGAGRDEENDQAVAEQPAGANDNDETPLIVVAEGTPEDAAQPSDVTVADPEDAIPAAKQQWVTLGSIDPTTGYRMLITFNSAGGAIERIELSDPRYQDLSDKSAYIGHLALESSGQGAVVHVVGHGTPAFLAGIKVGDTITQIGESPVDTGRSAEQALSKFKGGDVVSITLLRNGQTHTISVNSARRPLEVIRPEGLPNDVPGMQQLSYLLTLHQVGHKKVAYGKTEIDGLPSLRTENWYTSTDEVDTVEFRFPLTSAALKAVGVNGAFEIVKRFSLPKFSEATAPAEDGRDYHFDFKLDIANKSSDALEIGYRLDGPTGLPLEGWWYSYKTHPTKWSGAGVRDVVWRPKGGNHEFLTNPVVTKRLKSEKETPELVFVETDTQMQYLGVDAQYFNCSILAASEDTAVMLQRADARALSKVDELRASRTPITFRADSALLHVPANQTATHDFEIFAGPKHPDVLEGYDLGECIVYGWFKAPALFMGWLLHMLHAVVGNYGLAIILLTVLVRGCMFPIGRQQAKNAKKMQELTPEIKKIKEKYPSDTEKQAKAQQELFRKHNYNPVAGCLPMFLQLPIFIGLYRALSVDIELRQTPLIPGIDWCANLAAPDMLFRWDALLPLDFLTGYTGFLGPYFNLLPLISGGLFFLQSQLFTPPPADEQQEMQQKVMKFMMLFMALLFFKVAAGLCIYFITSSIWGVCERLLLPKDDKKDGQETPVSLAKATPEPVGASAGGTQTAAATRKKRKKRNKK